MRYAQTVRFNLSHDRRKTNTNDVYSAEDAVINFGDNQTLLWSEIKDTVDFTKLIVDSSGNLDSSRNLTPTQKTAAETLHDVIDIKNSIITNRHPGDFLLESDAGNTTQSIINGGDFKLSGPETQIKLDGTKGGGSTKTTTITEEQVQIADTDDSTLLTFTSDSIQTQDGSGTITITPNSIQIADTDDSTLLTFSSDSIQTQDGSGTITITPNSIQFEPVLQNQSTLTSVTIGTPICILGTIDLGASPTSHESGPEYKLTVRVNKQSSQSMLTDYMAFTMHINVGSWLNNINNPNSYTLLDDASFNEGSDRLLFSDNISGQTFYYKRDGRTISIAWLPVEIDNVTPLQYKLTQVA